MKAFDMLGRKAQPGAAFVQADVLLREGWPSMAQVDRHRTAAA
ncbi:hypothetical protein [Pseudomonas sp. FEN]|nr:hypothetical protein [Pseudomonas sp. FEN]